VRQYLRRGRVWTRLALALVVATCAFSAPASGRAAATPSYLEQMPNVRAVLEGVHGSDRLDTWARRYATFERLVAILGALEGPREFNPPPAEQRIGSEYRGAIGQLAAQVPQSGRSEWFNRAWGYESNAGFNNALLARYFSKSVRAAYAKANAANIKLSADKRAEERAAAKQAEQQAQSDGDAKLPLRVKIIFGVLVVLVGLGGGARWVWVYYVR
jgi:hypothetical protein